MTISPTVCYNSRVDISIQSIGNFLLGHMNYFHHISTVVGVLESYRPLYQELLFIDQLNQFFDFDYNIFMIDTSVDPNRFIDDSRHQNAPRSVYHLQTLDDDEKELRKLERLTKIAGKKLFFIVVTNEINLKCNSSLQLKLTRMYRWKRDTQIGVFISRDQKTANVDYEKFLSCCLNQGLVNIFVVTFSTQTDGSMHMFITIYYPFEKVHLWNVTENRSFDRIFPDQRVNFHLHPLRLPRRFGLELGDIGKIFCKLLNATPTVGTDVLDIKTPILSTYSTSSNGLQLYPITTETYVMVVPDSLPYTAFTSYLISITSNVTFHWSIAVLAAVIALLTVIRYFTSDRLEFLSSVMDVVNLLRNDNTSIRYPKLSPAEISLLVPLTFAGLIIGNGILSGLQSFSTHPIMQPEIYKIEDLYQSPYPILTRSGALEKELLRYLNDRYQREDWSSKIILAVDTSNRRAQYFLSFLSLETLAKAMMISQKKWGVRGFHILQETAVMKKLSTLHLKDDFPFIERLDEISLRLHQAGLYKKWLDNAMHVWSNAYNEHLSTDSNIGKELSKMPMIVIHGWLVSGLVFLLELFWKSFRSWCSHRNYFKTFTDKGDNIQSAE